MKLNKGLAKGIAKISLIVLVVLAFAIFVLNFVLPSFATETRIWTTDAEGNERTDFKPGDLVYIRGEGFNPNSQVNITITRPDGEKSTSSTTTDSDGNFVYVYDLNGIKGEYLVEATDGTNSAQTSFTDYVSSLYVIYPNGGEIVSGTINVQFYVNAEGSPPTGTVYVYYRKDGCDGWVWNWNLIGSVSINGDGIYSIQWNTTTVVNDNDYCIGIWDGEYGFFSDIDKSDSVFTVNNQVAICGNGQLEPGEDCEAPFGPCCDNTTCKFKSSDTICRPATGAFKPNGTLCGEARDCSDSGCYGYFAKIYPPDGHDYCDGEGHCVEYSCDLINSYCCDNDPNDGVNNFNCSAECDQDLDCRPYIDNNDNCHYDRICQNENCTCSPGNIEYCPEAGTIANGNCYWGTRDCNDQEGCTLTVTEMGCRDVCNSQSGPVDSDGPITSNVAANPQPPKYDPVLDKFVTTLTATETEDCTNITAAEYFLRRSLYCGPAGTGVPMSASDGDFDEQVEDVSATLLFSGGDDGLWYVCVRGKNSDGVWGDCSCITLGVDTIPPDCPTNVQMPQLVCSNSAYFNETICDSESKMQAAKYYFNRSYTNGYWMNAVDGDFDERCEDVYAILDFTNMQDGCYSIQSHGKDVAENWGKLPPQFCEDTERYFILDRTPPTTSKQISGPKHECTEEEKNYYGYQDCQFITNTTQISFSAVDPNYPCHSNAPKIYYKIGYKVNWEDEWQWSGPFEYTTPITLPQDSYHLIEYWSVDACGNEETHKFELDIVDNTPPKTTKTVGEPKVEGDHSPIDYYITGNTKIILNCSDQQPHPVDHVVLNWQLYYSQSCVEPQWTLIASGSEQGGYKEITGLTDSCYKIVYSCVDVLGNAETEKIEIDAVDNKAPTITKSIIGSSFGNCLPEEATQVSFLVEDNFEGVDDTTGFSTSGGTNNLGKSHLDILNGKGDVNGYWNGNSANFGHRGIRGLGVWGGGDDDEVDYTIGRWERIEITFDKPYYIDYVELRSLFANECVGTGEKAHIEYYLDNNLVASENPIGVQTTGGNGTWSKNYSVPILTDKIKFYAENDGCSEFAVARIGLVECFVDSATLIHVESQDQEPHPVDQVTCNWSYVVKETGATGSETNLTPPFDINFPEESTHVLTITCKDTLGNSVTDVETFLVDKTPPTTTKSYGQPYYTDGTSEWINSSTPITLTAEDTGPHKSGIKVTKYRVTQVNDSYCSGQDACMQAVGSGEWEIYTQPFTISGDSCHLIEFFSKDNVDKVEDVKKQCVYVDNTGPIVNKSIGEPKYPCAQDEGCNYYITQNTLITLECIDQQPHPVGGDKIYYRYKVDNETWTEWILYEGPFSFKEDSIHEIEYYCVDKLGNVGQVASEVDKVDSTPPTTTKSYGQPYYTDGTSEWINSSTPITLTAEDGGEICAVDNVKIYYMNTIAPSSWCSYPPKYCHPIHDYEDEGWVEYTGPFNKTEESCHLIEYYSVDVLGNKEQIKAQCVYVDNTPPKTTKTVGDPKVEGNHSPIDYYITSNTQITLSCSDQEPHPVGKDKIYYRYYYNGSWTDWTEYTQPFSFPEECLHELEYYCVDLLGNAEEVKSEIDEVDNTPPEVLKAWVDDCSVHCGTPVKIFADVTDAKVGVGEVKAKIEKWGQPIIITLAYNSTSGFYEGTWTPSCWLWEGTYYIDIVASDLLDNTATLTKATWVNVDNLGPQVKWVFSGKDWVGYGTTFYVAAEVTDNSLTKPWFKEICEPEIICAARIVDNKGKESVLEGSLTFNREIGKCTGFVTVNETFDESPADLYVDAWDNAGNYGDWTHILIGIDNTPPIKVSFETNPEQGSTIKSGQRIWYRITFEQDMSGIASPCYISINETRWDASPIVGNECSGYYDVPSGLEDGVVKFMLKVQDEAGNWLEDSINFILDNTPPTIELLQPGEGPYDSLVPIEINITDELSPIASETVQYRIFEPPAWYSPWLCLFGICPYDSGWLTATYNSATGTYQDIFNATELEEGKTYFLSIRGCDVLYDSVLFTVNSVDPYHCTMR